MKLPTLYKKTSTGAIQQWSIHVINQRGSDTAACIVTEYGQVNGKIQTTSDLIAEGKNIGKANETSPRQQAEAEAIAKHEKQRKKGYVESIKDAESGKLDDLIEGGIVPMLAHKFSEQGHKIKYPCHVQPKLDGIRCIAILKNGKCTLWSRTRKPIKSVPHIIAEIEKNFKDDIVLDGELYNSEFKDNFEHIVHLVRQDKKPDSQCTDVQYHIYDTFNEDTFEKRTKKIFNAFNVGKSSFQYLIRVETEIATNEEDVMEAFVEFRKRGYEGAMLRNSQSLYVNKRSYDLLKVKEFDDKEFPIIDVKEGRGKLAGHAIFICKLDNGETFEAKLKGDTEKLKEFWEDHSLWKGKALTVQYQGLTAYGIPRFPVGVAIRDYE